MKFLALIATAAAFKLVVGDDEPVDHSKEVFQAADHEQLGTMGGERGYERVTPARFAADSDDIFMRSMIEQYAQEHKNKDGSPNGVFTMSEGSAKAAASESLATNAKMANKDIGAYLATYWGKAWGHFDVNRTGSIEVIKMPQLMRFLASDQQMYLW